MTKPHLTVVAPIDDFPAPVSPWSDADMTDEALEAEWNARMAALTAAPKPVLHRKTEKRQLPCQITADEFGELVDEIKDADRHKANLENELADLHANVKSIKGMIEGQDKTIRKARLTLDAGTITKLVEIEIQSDYDAGLIHEIRLDTGEMSSRTMTGAERQMKLV